MGQCIETLGEEVSDGRWTGVQSSDLDCVDPLRTLAAGQTPPFASNGRIRAVSVYGDRLSEEGGGHEGEFREPMDEHS